MQTQQKKWFIMLFSLTGILATTIMLSLCLGSASISLQKVFSLLLHQTDSPEYSIILKLRLPRIILGLAVGGALSLSGVILQGIFRNPLVEPYTLGISGGAALGVALNIIFKLQNKIGIFSLPFMGFLGALSIIIILYFLTIQKGRFKIHELLLTGVMISFISSSLLMLIMAISTTEELQNIIFWIMGSLEESNWTLIKLSIPISLISLLISYFYCLDLNALSLGEEEALSLGIKTETVKRTLFILASILTGLSVSIAGIIGFVGLIIPHFMRLLFGKDYRSLLLSSFLGGAIFLISCDTIARTIIAPIELPVGVITGIIGGSLFVYALKSKRTL